MNEDWRIRECTNQLLLSFAFEARNALVGSLGPAIPGPEPLPPFRGRLQTRLARELFERVARHPGDIAPLRKELDRIPRLEQKPEWVKGITAAAPWAVGELVQWWLAAGTAVARWREARAARAARPMSQVGVSDRVATVQRTEDWLWSATARRLLIDDDEEYPPLWWAAEAAGSRRASAPDDVAPAAGWDGPGSSREEYLCGLLEWWGDLRRDPPDMHDKSALEAWVSDQEARSRDLARAGLRLLGHRCRCVRRPPSPATAPRWRAFRAIPSRSGFVVLRWPLERQAGTPWLPAVCGWTVVPHPAAVVEQLAAAAPAASIRRAASRPWPAEARSFGPLPPWSESGREDPADLAAVARLALVTELLPPSDVGEPRDREGDGLDAAGRLRLALSLEGFELQWRAATGAEERLVPLGPGCGDLPVEGGRLVIRMQGSDREVDVGVVGPPARCPDDLLAAIEELDWRLWAGSVLAETGPQADRHSEFVELARRCGWEQLKRSLLELDPAKPGADLEEAVGRLNAFALEVHAKAAAQVDAAIPRDLAREIDGVLRPLVALRPGDEGGWYPPRGADGRIELAAWMGERAGGDPRAAGWEVAWERQPAPFGAQVAESADATGRRAVFSAGADVTDADLRLLNLPGLVIGPPPPWDGLCTPLRERIAATLAEAGPAALPAAVADLRAACEAVAATSFDALLQQAISGAGQAVTWVRILADDPRFAFSCHPAVEISAAGVALRPAAIGEGLEWRDDDRPADTDLELTFALDPARARRVLSRGRPDAASAEACAARLEDAVRDVGPESAPAAVALRRATDLRRLFGEAAADPLPLALAAAEAVRGEAELLPAERAVAAIAALGDWCAATGSKLVPGEWHPTDGSPPEGQGPEQIRFHACVPVGRVVVERFGAVAGDGSPAGAFQGFLSAGPAPAGFTEVAELAAPLTGDGEELQRLHRCIGEFPRRVGEGKGSNAAKSLFDIAWKASQASPGDEGLEALVRAVHGLLDRAYGMVLFEPASVDDFPEPWLRTADGGVPRGTRVRQIIRPGLRTRTNELVWHAIVEAG